MSVSSAHRGKGRQVPVGSDKVRTRASESCSRMLTATAFNGDIDTIEALLTAARKRPCAVFRWESGLLRWRATVPEHLCHDRYFNDYRKALQGGILVVLASVAPEVDRIALEKKLSRKRPVYIP